jgi:hypothetical protein
MKRAKTILQALRNIESIRAELDKGPNMTESQRGELREALSAEVLTWSDPIAEVFEEILALRHQGEGVSQSFST